jgi:hypothetical protein
MVEELNVGDNRDTSKLRQPQVREIQKEFE